MDDFPCGVYFSFTLKVRSFIVAIKPILFPANAFLRQTQGSSAPSAFCDQKPAVEKRDIFNKRSCAGSMSPPLKPLLEKTAHKRQLKWSVKLYLDIGLFAPEVLLSCSCVLLNSTWFFIDS